MKSTSLNLLRPTNLIALQRERDEINEKLNGPWKHLIQQPGLLYRRLREIDQLMNTHAPEPITNGAERDKLSKRADELLEQITEGMLTQEEMRKNPPGAVDHLRAWERHNKPKILEWKNIRLQLAADTSDPETWNRDEANLERYRPAGATGRVRLDAQIPGKMAMSTEAKENWPLGEPTATTATAHIKVRKPLTDSQRAAARERLAKARARKASLHAAAAQSA